MSEPKIGRVLVASLHQAIHDLVPTRGEFYEEWLSARRIREGEVGRARVAAAISFLREEGEDYSAVVDRAGRYAVDWTVGDLPSVERLMLRRLPRSLRVRGILRASARLIRNLHEVDQLDFSVRHGAGVVRMEGSLFCDVREPAGRPLCGFYGGLIERYFEFFNVSCEVQISQCRGTGEPSCELLLDTNRSGL